MEAKDTEMMKETIQKMIEQIIDNCLPWIQKGDDGLCRFVDPNDNEEISAHYGATHAAAAFITYGVRKSNMKLLSKGCELLESILKRWGSIVKLSDFHNDFNNFALCLVWEQLHALGSKEELANKVRKTVMDTPDSNNPTVNWYPMRWYVNLIRYQWTSDKKFKNIVNQLRGDIEAATYVDGFIDDRLPTGLSFNLQYNVATVAAMQFLRSKGEDINISKEIGALENAVAPDGDINYLGRGTNQIFAWGLWIYLLAASGQHNQLVAALDYLSQRLPKCLANHNIMLNEWRGDEKYLWWDYHYCSVYTAHMLLWLVLAEQDLNKFPVEPVYLPCGSSGVHIYRDDDYFICTFDGRSEYLSERGPSIVALWTRNAGMIAKGTFGPWQGAFGNKYCPTDITLRNYFGLIEVARNKDYSKNRYVHKLIPGLERAVHEKFRPLFRPLDVSLSERVIIISWNVKNKTETFLNIPLISGCENILLMIDREQQHMSENAMIKNQYGWVRLIQSKRSRGHTWEVIIKR